MELHLEASHLEASASPIARGRVCLGRNERAREGQLDDASRLSQGQRPGIGFVPCRVRILNAGGPPELS